MELELIGQIFFYIGIILLVISTMIPLVFAVRDGVELVLGEIRRHKEKKLIDACLECPYKKYFLNKENIELDSEFTEVDVKILLRDLVNRVNSKTYLSISDKLSTTYSDIGKIADRVCLKVMSKRSPVNSQELKISDIRQEVVNVLREYIDD